MFGMPEVASNLTGSAMLFYIGWQLVGWVRERRNKRDGRQENYIELSQKLESEGFEMCSNVLLKLGVGNYSGAYTEAKTALDMMKDEKKRIPHFDKLAIARLPAMLKDEDRRGPLVKAYEAFRQGNPGVATAIRAQMEAENPDKALADKVVSLEKELDGKKQEAQAVEITAALADKVVGLVEEKASKAAKRAKAKK